MPTPSHTVVKKQMEEKGKHINMQVESYIPKLRILIVSFTFWSHVLREGMTKTDNTLRSFVILYQQFICV